MLLWTHNYTWGPAFFLCTLLSLSFLSDLLHLWFPTSPSRCLDLKLHSCGWRAGRREPRVPGYFEPSGETRLPGRLCNLFFSSLLSYERTYIHAARSSESGELVWLYICRIKCIYRLRSDKEESLRTGERRDLTWWTKINMSDILPSARGAFQRD